MNNNNTQNTTLVAGQATENNQQNQINNDRVNDRNIITMVEEAGQILAGKMPSISRSFLQGSDEKAELARFMARPIKIINYTWNVNSNLNVSFNPWLNFVQDSTINNKLANYQLGRWNLRIKIVINGTPFHYGIMLASYNPYNDYSRNYSGYATAVGSIGDLMQKSQRPHAFLNPTTNQTVELELPFFYHKNWVSLSPYGEWSTLGVVSLDSINLLRVANDTATQSLNIQVFAYATDIELAVPTARPIAQMDDTNLLEGASKVVSKQMEHTNDDEHQKDGMISAPATAIAKGMNEMASVPVIGPLAKATAMGAEIVGNVASLFGFSKPTNVTDIVKVRNTPITDYAVTNGNDNVMKLSFDIKQETTISKSIGGLKDGTDEMSIPFISGVESYIGSCPWNQSAASESTIFWLNVSPILTWIDSSISGGRAFQTIPMGFCAMPFQYWSGSIILRFQIAASKYHHGRFRVVYEPTGYNSTDQYNTVYNHVLDLQSSADFEVTISWAQSEPYKKVPNPTIQYYSIDGTGIVNYDANVHNGIIYFKVVNELTAPNTNPAFVNVYARAGPDFEVFGPQSARAHGGYSFQKVVNSYNGPELAETNEENIAEAQADNIQLINQVDDFENIQLVGVPTPELLDEKALTFAGEKIDSFRAYLKRYNFAQMLYNLQYTDFAFTYTKYTINNFPIMRGNGNSSMRYVHDTPLTPLMAFLRGAYVGWRGGIRYKYTQVNPKNNIQLNATRTFLKENNVAFFNVLSSNSQPQLDLYSNNIFNDFIDTWQGSAVTSSNNMNSLQVEVPYYSQYRFCFSTNSNLPLGIPNDASDTMYTSFTSMTMRDAASASLPIEASVPVASLHVAAAEDFNFLWFINVPGYFIPTPPV